MQLATADHDLLRRAVELAHQSIGLSEPNPRVGCVLYSASGALAGEGCTQQVGGPHAEIMALRAAASAGVDVRGGTAWVSLEPCAHHGRTPPCCDALVAAGLARVVVALKDPFPLVAGQGVDRLRAAGIAVEVAATCLAMDDAFELNIGYFSRILRRRPWVRMKIAASLDGRTALPNGVSQWITGAEARIDAHRWRRRAGAILTGIGTVRNDDPRLDVRDVATTVQPRRVVVDSKLALPIGARILRAPGQTLAVHAGAASIRSQALVDQGVSVMSLPGIDGRVDLVALMTHLADSGVNELHVEAGATLNAALIEADLVDELLVYLAPKIIGQGRGMFDLQPLDSLVQVRGFCFTDFASVGGDMRLMARPPGRALFNST